MSENVTLYHGSYCIVKSPTLSFCSKAKDFGRGFYLTTDAKQARNFIQTAVKKAMYRGLVSADCSLGYVNIFECDLNDTLSVYSFGKADESWLHCVAAHRSESVFPGEAAKWLAYDLIRGKIANDKTNTVISAYIDGLYGPAESKQAAEIAIGLLEPENLVDQWCFRTEKALATLKFVGADVHEP